MHDNDQAPDEPPVWAKPAPGGLVAARTCRGAGRIEALMEYWGITVEDLLAPTPRSRLSRLPGRCRSSTVTRPPAKPGMARVPIPSGLRRALLQEA
jgi:hypothetical protein